MTVSIPLFTQAGSNARRVGVAFVC